MDLKLFPVIDEQVAVQFTGKINVLSRFNRQFLGHILFLDGQLIQAQFSGQKSLKALYHLFIEELSLAGHDYVVEPEVVEEKERQIHYPWPVLKNRLSEVLKQYRESLGHRPPMDLKIQVVADVLDDTIPLSAAEFDVLATLTEWSQVHDVYQHCALLDHEITLALVGLRKKGALKVIAPKNAAPP